MPAGEIAIMDERAQRVAAKFWPGALTLVLARAPGCPIAMLASAGLVNDATLRDYDDLAAILAGASAPPSSKNRVPCAIHNWAPACTAPEDVSRSR